jgi:hexosaminidase
MATTRVLFGYSALLLLAALLHEADAAPLALASGEEVDSYKKYAQSDCGGRDVKPQPSCGGNRNLSVAVLEACCDSTLGCGGFNTNGVIKDTACSSHIGGQPACDLYIKPAVALPSAMPWPFPNDAKMSTGTTILQLSHNFTISAAGPACPTLNTAMQRYQNQAVGLHIASPPGNNDGGPVLRQLLVQVANLDESHPQLNTTDSEHEAYVLTIPADGSPATLTAETIWGAMWGMESFSQIVRFDFETEAYSIANAPWHVHDTPRFPHRGLMIDCSRHFLPLASIRSIIDSLAYAKMNVLHMHIVDEQSFPIQIKSYPKLWDAAYSAQERYTQADLASLVEYARLRAIRVMVEFDVPGHSKAWCKGYPEVCTACTAQKGSTLPMNVARNATFALLESLLGEMTGGTASTVGSPKGLFPGNMIHLGGDEVDADCFNRDPEIAAWMVKRGINASEAYGYFTQRVGAMAKAQGRRVVQWAEVYANVGTKLDKSSIVHIWRSAHIARHPAFNRYISPAQVVADGYQTLVNIGYDPTSWYLDNLHNTWAQFYRNEPCLNITDADCSQYVLGGEGEMWGESVDASDLDQTVWPRLAAVAERLWSPRNMTDETSALPRIQSFRCLLNKRGIKAAPVINANARSAPPGTGSCYAQ